MAEQTYTQTYAYIILNNTIYFFQSSYTITAFSVATKKKGKE